MIAKLLDGQVIAGDLEKGLKLRVEKLKSKQCVPGLIVILVGEDPASQTYVQHKMLACERLGIHSITRRLPADTTQEELEQTIVDANNNNSIHGILVQLPLPQHLNSNKILDLIAPEKDVDGFHDINIARLLRGLDCIAPCTPKGIVHMLKSANIPIAGADIVVVGRSNIVGKPLAMLLLQENATVTMCHSYTKNLKAHTQRADIVVVAIGKAKFITADMIKPGAVVIDAGINRVNGKLCGDVDFETVRQVASYITPVPGGVGKMTIAMLMNNTIEVAEKVNQSS